MDFFDYLYLFGGLSLFLFGMKFLSSEIQSRADERLKNTILSVSNNKYKGFIFGVLSTALIQSSSAITAMITDFAGAGLLPVENTVGIIIGSNIGTTVTAWLIGAAGINASIPFFSFLKPAAIASLFSIIGIIFCSTGIKNDRRKNTGSILFGFSMIMYGLYFMSESAQGLKNEEWAMSLFSSLSSPLAGFAAGAAVTALVQSSSVSVGILQAVSVTGAFDLYSCVPIILGQNVGACSSALIASVSNGRESKATAMIHLYFNVFSSFLFYVLLRVLLHFFDIDIFYSDADGINIAFIHTLFNVFAAAVMLPLSSPLQKAAVKSVKMY